MTITNLDLMQCIKDQPQRVPSILTKLLQSKNDGSIKNVFTKKNDEGNNALMIAARNNHEAVKPILEALKGLGDDQETLKKVLQHKGSGCWNALMIAARNNHEAVKPILEALKGLGDDQETLKKVLAQTSRFGENALMIAAKKQTYSLPFILSTLKDIPKDKKTLKKVLTQTNQAGKTALEIAPVNSAALKMMNSIKSTISGIKVQNHAYSEGNKYIRDRDL